MFAVPKSVLESDQPSYLIRNPRATQVYSSEVSTKITYLYVFDMNSVILPNMLYSDIKIGIEI